MKDEKRIILGAAFGSALGASVGTVVGAVANDVGFWISMGISFGADRIYDVMFHLDKFPPALDQSLRVLFVALDEESHRYAFKALTRIRKAGIPADLYPEPTKMKKQMKYADSRNVPYVAIAGESERLANNFAVKDMQSGQQENMDIDTLIKLLSEK